MRGVGRGITGAAMLLLVSAGSLAAQNWRIDAGGLVGGAWRTASVSPATGDDMKFGPRWLVGAQLGARILPRLGVRVNGTYSMDPFEQGSTELYDKILQWSLTGDLLLRLREPATQFTKTEYLPYVALGAGARWIAPTGHTYQGVYDASGDLVPVALVGGYGMEWSRVPLGLVGVGTDVRFKRPLALRVEVGDRFYKPQIDALSGYTITDSDAGKLTHELYGTVGLHYLLGFPGRAVVAQAKPIAAPPPPPPPPTPPAVVAAPPPPPPPPPADQPVTLCVIDPGIVAGMQTVQGFFLPQTADTVVVVQSVRHRIAEAYADRVIASDQDWYATGAPLNLGTAARPIQFMAFGTSRTVQPGQVVYIGHLRRLPVFADPDEAGGLIAALDKISTTRREDLTRLAADHPALLKELRALKTIYVPVKRTGCVVQPMQLQEEVRKVRG